MLPPSLGCPVATVYLTSTSAQALSVLLSKKWLDFKKPDFSLVLLALIWKRLLKGMEKMHLHRMTRN